MSARTEAGDDNNNRQLYPHNFRLQTLLCHPRVCLLQAENHSSLPNGRRRSLVWQDRTHAHPVAILHTMSHNLHGGDTVHIQRLQQLILRWIHEQNLNLVGVMVGVHDPVKNIVCVIDLLLEDVENDILYAVFVYFDGTPDSSPTQTTTEHNITKFAEYTRDMLFKQYDLDCFGCVLEMGENEHQFRTETWIT